MSVPLLITSQLIVMSTAEEMGGGRVRCPLINIWSGPSLFSFFFFFFLGCWCVEQCGVVRHSWTRFVLWVVHRSDKPNKMPHCLGCCYCHDCMFCFQPNELRWYHPLWDCNINEETQKEHPFSVKIMMSLSMQLNELHAHTHTHTHTHTCRHSGGHFQPINRESAQSRTENNLLHPEKNTAPSQSWGR